MRAPLIISENIGTIAVLVILAVISALIVWRIIKNKKEGKSSCGCGCSNCPMSGECRKK